MEVRLDGHIHSRYARATSKDCDLEHYASEAKRKGLNLLSVGDFTHPSWLAEVKAKIGKRETGKGTGIYEYGGMSWLMSTEVATYYYSGGKSRRVHHLVFAPDMDAVDQINSRLSKFGKMGSDGRLALQMSPAELVDEAMVSDDVLVIPAHLWTAYFGAFGSATGFDSLKDCYGDKVGKIRAIETGLSSDPLMNWRVSELDKVSLVSFSDAHSPWLWRLGREVTVFDTDEMTYRSFAGAVTSRRLKFTCEVPVEYGKYHVDAHRACKVFLHPSESRKINDICPVCHKKLTIGVEHRVEDLADRPGGFVPEGATPYKTMLPLYEVISFSVGSGSTYSKETLTENDRLIKAFGTEWDVLFNADRASLEKATSKKVVDAIFAVREGRLHFDPPGGDGEYGRPVFDIPGVK